MMSQQRVTWGPDGFAKTEGWALAHCASVATAEYIGEQNVWVSAGTGLPAGAYLDAPPAKEPGKAIVRRNDAWAQVDDYRGQTAYDKQTRTPSVINEPGEVPVTQTLITPSSQFDVWDEDRDIWFKDVGAENAWQLQQNEAKRSVLMVEANQQIAILTDAVDLGIATDAEQTAYTIWRQYRVLLSRLDLTQPNLNWPAKPVAVA